MLSRFSCARRFVIPWTVARQAPLSMGFSRQEYWSGVPCLPPGDLSNPGIEPISLMSPVLAGGFFTTSAYLGSLQLSLEFCNCLPGFLEDPVTLFNPRYPRARLGRTITRHTFRPSTVTSLILHNALVAQSSSSPHCTDWQTEAHRGNSSYLKPHS